MNSVKAHMHKSFNVMIVVLMYWVFVHVVIAVHSSFFPFVTRFLSIAPWYVMLAFTGLLSFIHVSYKDILSSLFDIDLKVNMSLTYALDSISRFVPSKQKYLMALAGFYILTCGSMLSGLLASFFSFHNVFAKWLIYLIFLAVVFFLLKQLISTWAKSYLNVYGV